MAAAAPIFTAAGAAVPCSAFRRGAGRHATAAAREAAAATREFGGGDDGLTTAAAENAPLPNSSSLLTHRVVAEYLYLGGSGTDMRSVTRVVEVPRGALGAAARPDPSVVAALPLIAVDGAATRQGGLGGGSNHCSALFLKPRSAWLDPLRGGGALLVLCEAYSPPALGPEVAKKCSPNSPISTQQPNSSSSRKLHPAALSPHPTNNRAFAERAARAAASEEPLFAVTQQYLLCEGDGRPLGEWSAGGREGKERERWRENAESKTREERREKTRFAPPSNDCQLRPFSRASRARVFTGPRSARPRRKGSIPVGGRRRCSRDKGFAASILLFLRREQNPRPARADLFLPYFLSLSSLSKNIQQAGPPRARRRLRATALRKGRASSPGTAKPVALPL